MLTFPCLTLLLQQVPLVLCSLQVQVSSTRLSALVIHIDSLSQVFCLFCWIFLSRLFTAAFLKHPRTPPGALGMDYQTADSEHPMKRIRPGQPDEVQKLEKPSLLPLGFLIFWFILTSKNILFRFPFLVQHLPTIIRQTIFQKMF